MNNPQVWVVEVLFCFYFSKLVVAKAVAFRRKCIATKLSHFVCPLWPHTKLSRCIKWVPHPGVDSQTKDIPIVIL
jgi:hypothetical protein